MCEGLKERIGLQIGSWKDSRIKAKAKLYKAGYQGDRNEQDRLIHHIILMDSMIIDMELVLEEY